MTRMPLVSGREAARAFQGIGSAIDHQTGSHIIDSGRVELLLDRFRQDAEPHRRLTIPDHKELGKGTLRAIIRQAGLTVDEFRALL